RGPVTVKTLRTDGEAGESKPGKSAPTPAGNQMRFRCGYCNQLVGGPQRKAGQLVQWPTCRVQGVVPTSEAVTKEPAQAPKAGEDSGLIPGPVSQPSTDAVGWYQVMQHKYLEGEEHLKRGDYRRAIACMDEVLQYDPTCAHALQLRDGAL